VEAPLDVVSVDERVRTGLDGVEVLLAAVEVAVVPVGDVAPGDGDLALQVRLLEIVGEAVAHVDQFGGHLAVRTPRQSDALLGRVTRLDGAVAARPALQFEGLESSVVSARVVQRVAGGFGSLAFALATGHPVADVDEALEVVPAAVARERLADPIRHALHCFRPVPKRSGIGHPGP
jgi:hypothetical protein